MLEKEQAPATVKALKHPILGPRKGPKINTASFGSPKVSLSTTQLCLCVIEAAMVSERMGGLTDGYRGGL